MPNFAQLELLNSFIGEEGIDFETIRDNQACNLGTKVLYLERAISQNCQNFLQSLDKLYNRDLEGDAKTANVELIRSLKRINDLCFNHQVKYGGYGIKSALTHFFGSLGVVEPGDFQTTIQTIINQKIIALQEAHMEEATAQKTVRETIEVTIARQTEWRGELDLPVDQRARVFVQYAPQGFFQPQPAAPAVNIYQIPQSIYALVPEASRVDLLQACSEQIRDRAWVYISFDDMPERLAQFAQSIPDDFQNIKHAAENCVIRALAYPGTKQCFFMNDPLAKEVLVSALLIGQYQHDDNLKNLALDLIANMHLQRYLEDTMQHFLGEQLPAHAM